jgi:acyl-CoA reductase-like NAD-dependent aldehyde dehydrogenase
MTPTFTPLLIGGEEREAGDSFPVYDPSNRQLIGHAAAASTSDAEDAVRAAHEAWAAWAALPTSERVRLALASLEGLESDADERAELLVHENGKTRTEATIDSLVLVGRFHQAAAVAAHLDEEETLSGPPFATTIAHVPVGVVTIIFPFNWPLAILGASLPFALMSGNTIVVKPPPTTPMSVVRTLRHLALALPPGVLNVVTGADAVVGPVVVGDPLVKHICFTGSVGAGRQIMQAAAANLTRVTLELGGNDPAVVLDDAAFDEEEIERLAAATFMTTGQVCMAIKRLYVPRARFEDVVSGLESVLARTVVGSGLDPGVTMGPLHTERQRDFVVELVSEARTTGAEVREAGSFACDPDSGHYLLPSLVLDPGRDLRIVTEEQFGPTLPVIPYDDEAEAIALANGTWSGLCSSVWSTDEEHAMKVARQLRTGVTFFNNHNATAVDERAPFGGFNQSGIGRELGREGLLEFTETHVMSAPVSSDPG